MNLDTALRPARWLLFVLAPLSIAGCIDGDEATAPQVGAAATSVAQPEVAPAGTVRAIEGACNASIDAVNGQGAAQGLEVRRGTPLTLSGWSAHDPKDGQANDSIFLFVTNLATGEERIFATRKNPRQDVKTYLGHPDMGDVGYETTVLLDQFTPGAYRLGLYTGWAGELVRCESPSLSITLTD